MNVGVTFHPSLNSNMINIDLYFLINLLMYTYKVTEMFEELRGKSFGTIPIIPSDNLDLKEKNNEFHGRSFKTNPKISATRNRSNIDMTFGNGRHKKLH